MTQIAIILQISFGYLAVVAHCASYSQIPSMTSEISNTPLSASMFSALIIICTMNYHPIDVTNIPSLVAFKKRIFFFILET